MFFSRNLHKRSGENYFFEIDVAHYHERKASLKERYFFFSVHGQSKWNIDRITNYERNVF